LSEREQWLIYELNGKKSRVLGFFETEEAAIKQYNAHLDQDRFTGNERNLHVTSVRSIQGTEVGRLLLRGRSSH
jgi:hypothetical protein